MRGQFKSEAEARRALDEIERLVRDAESGGIQLYPWLYELAEELRAVVPAADARDAAAIARRIAAEPHASLAAQSRVRGPSMGALKG